MSSTPMTTVPRRSISRVFHEIEDHGQKRRQAQRPFCATMVTLTAPYTDAVGIDQIRSYADGLASLADPNSLTLPVPTCDQWTMADLTWHLTWVQSFWAFIIANRPAGPETYDHPERPPDSALAGALRSAAERLSEALTDAAPGDTAWSWAHEQTVAFSLRRQTHESFIHYADGLLAMGEPVAEVDAKMAADGVDEMVEVMLCPPPTPGAERRTTTAMQLNATDTGDSWILGWGPGHSPDKATMFAPTDQDPDAQLSATARDLYLWLWGRGPDTGLRTDGDADLVAKLRNAVSESTQ